MKQYEIETSGHFCMSSLLMVFEKGSACARVYVRVRVYILWSWKRVAPMRSDVFVCV